MTRYISEPPSSLTIIDWSGSEVDETAGPYTLDTIVTLTCVSSGGEQIFQILNKIHLLPCQE